MSWLDALFHGVAHEITQYFGYTGNPNYLHGVHTGVDIGVPQGTALYAPVSGRVTFAGLGNIGPGIGTVEITADDGTIYKFGHLSGWNVTAGSYIVAGSKFGNSGGAPATFGAGYSDGPHVHIEQWIGGKPVDPLTHAASGGSGAPAGGSAAPAGGSAASAPAVPFTREAMPAITFTVLGLALIAIGGLAYMEVI